MKDDTDSRYRDIWKGILSFVVRLEKKAEAESRAESEAGTESEAESESASRPEPAKQETPHYQLTRAQEHTFKQLKESATRFIGVEVGQKMSKSTKKQMQELDDNALLHEYVENDSEEAFAALVKRHVNKVYSVALRHTRNPHSAEEITQAVFVILAKKSAHLGKKVVLSGWLYETSRLTAVTFIRSEIRRARREQEAHMQNFLNKNEADVWPQIAPLLDMAMAGLSETDRHAVVLRFFDGKSIKEVGAALGASEDAAKMRLTRAVEKLRGFFTKRGIVLPASVLTTTISANSVQAAPAALAKSVTAVAIAKGAAASGSTLTLIKGALKIMAWTKAKTAIVVGVGILFAAGTATVTVKEIAARRTARHDIQGIWEGDMLTGGVGVNRGEAGRDRIVLKLSKTNRDYTATADLIDMGRKNVPVAIDYNYPLLRLSINPQVKLNGRVNTNGTQLNFGGVKLDRTNAPNAIADELTEAEQEKVTGAGTYGGDGTEGV